MCPAKHLHFIRFQRSNNDNSSLENVCRISKNCHLIIHHRCSNSLCIFLQLVHGDDYTLSTDKRDDRRVLKLKIRPVSVCHLKIKIYQEAFYNLSLQPCTKLIFILAENYKSLFELSIIKLVLI